MYIHTYICIVIDKIDHDDIIDRSNKNLKDQSNNKQQNRDSINFHQF